jgi:hypothetical protein
VLVNKYLLLRASARARSMPSWSRSKQWPALSFVLLFINFFYGLGCCRWLVVTAFFMMRAAFFLSQESDSSTRKWIRYGMETLCIYYTFPCHDFIFLLRVELPLLLTACTYYTLCWYQWQRWFWCGMRLMDGRTNNVYKNLAVPPPSCICCCSTVHKLSCLITMI